MPVLPQTMATWQGLMPDQTELDPGATTTPLALAKQAINQAKQNGQPRVLKQSLATSNAPDVPFAAQIADIQRRLAEPQAAMYTPEQIEQRRAQNKQQYQLGLLGMLSGDEALGNVGGQILKQALAARAPKGTERGSYDPITGQWTYDPAWRQEQLQNQLDRLQMASAQAQQTASEHEKDRQSKAELLQDRLEGQRQMRALTAAALAAGGSGFGGTAPQIGVDDKGAPIYRHTKSGQLFQYDLNGQPTQYQGGPVLSKQGQPSEDERKAAGWLAQSQVAYKNLVDAATQDPTAARQPLSEVLLQKTPMIGTMAANARMSPQRQRYVNAASEFSEAIARAASGANVPEHELRQKIDAVTPKYGDKPEVVADKERAMLTYLQSLQTRAGRAVPQSSNIPSNAAPSMPTGGNDPLGLFNK